MTMAKVSECKTQIYLTKELHRQVKAYARERGVSMAEVIRRAVEKYLEGELIPETDLQHDPLLKIVGVVRGLGIKDASIQHDRYVYGHILKGRRRKA